MNSKIIFIFIFCWLIVSTYGFLFFNKKKYLNENSLKNSQPISEEPNHEIKYNNLYLMSKRYDEFLSENYGIKQENINHDILTGNYNYINIKLN